MSDIALVIVIVAAFLHSGWNYFLKKSLDKLTYSWAFLVVSLVFYSPMFFYYWFRADIPMEGWLCIAATGLLHVLYYIFMCGAYERGDLSLVYPISRGSGPLLVPVMAVLFLHEKIYPMGALGIALVVSGIYVIHLRSFAFDSFVEPFRAVKHGASSWSIMTGLTIAAYSLVDKVGVGFVEPPLYIYFMLLIVVTSLSPYVLIKKREELRKEWRCNRNNILAVGVLVLLTYMMILFAFRMSNVSYVVAVRELSIVLSTIYGLVWFKEKHAMQKLTGSFIIALGVIFIGIS
ncbi:MAG: EamA family transporter [Deltaproteobacteria bacterium]|nr:EamA family transporter [Deltaproteobacteria bacterium]MBW2594544.1 EamA family transporter [Deltaproteobacteria bacterium]MBW2649623.1 EamA family transporter [Deltaproteobacteria bacterium]